MGERAGAPSAVFLDRDGTLIRDREYLADPARVELLPRAAEAVTRLNARRIPAIVVTNQSGIGRGYFSEEAFAAVQAEVERRLAVRGAALDAVFHCPHDPEREPECGCRKPAPALYREAADRFGLDLGRAAFVGDRVSDVLPALRWGGTGMLVETGKEVSPGSVPEGVRRVRDLWAAITEILDGRDGGDDEE